MLNAFEMLWNIESTLGKDGQKSTDESAKKGALSREEGDNLDLVKILSHTPANENENGMNFGSSKVQGHALTIKDEFLT